MSWTRRQALLGGAASALGLALPRRARAAGDGLLLVYWVPGGWDPTFVFDPHFESSTIARDPGSAPGTAGGLDFADSATRPSVARFLSRFADRTVVVNGMAVGSISHSQCSRMVLTGARDPRAADLGTRIAAGATRPYALPHLVVSGPRYPGALGSHVAPLGPLLTGTVRGELPRGGTFDTDREARIRAWLSEEVAALPSDPVRDVYAEGLERYAELEAAVDGIHVMEFATEPELLDAGVAALGQGLSRVVTVGGTLPFMSQWDSHTNNAYFQNRNFEHLFAELGQIMDRLAALPDPAGGGGSLADSTTIAVLSEMGRTPALNGAAGKDHWPYTSLMLIGPGVAGGRVLGATDGALVGQPIDLGSGAPSATGAVLTPAAVAAGLLQHLDVDPAEHFPGVTPFSAPYG